MAGITNVLVLFLWKAVVTMAMQGYVLTGPKSLLSNSVETFCVSIEGSHTIANCTLDLMAHEEDTIYASTNYHMKGKPLQDNHHCIRLIICL